MKSIEWYHLVGQAIKSNIKTLTIYLEERISVLGFCYADTVSVVQTYFLYKRLCL